MVNWEIISLRSLFIFVNHMIRPVTALKLITGDNVYSKWIKDKWEIRKCFNETTHAYTVCWQLWVIREDLETHIVRIYEYAGIYRTGIHTYIHTFGKVFKLRLTFLQLVLQGLKGKSLQGRLQVTSRWMKEATNWINFHSTDSQL